MPIWWFPPPPPQEEMGQSMKDATFTLTEAKYAAGDNFKHMIFENVGQATNQVLLS